MDWSTVTKDPRSRKGWAKRGRGKSLAQHLFRSDLEQGQREWNSPITTSAPSPVPLLAPSSLHFTAPLMKELRPGSIMSTEEWKRHTHPLRSRPRNTQSHVNFFIFRSLSVIRPKRGYGAILKACTAVDSVTTCLATLKQVDGKKMPALSGGRREILSKTFSVWSAQRWRLSGSYLTLQHKRSWNFSRPPYDWCLFARQL